MSSTDECSHRTIGEWNALYAERDRLERLWKSAEVQAEKTDDAYVAAVEQVKVATRALRRIALRDTPQGAMAANALTELGDSDPLVTRYFASAAASRDSQVPKEDTDAS